MSRLTFALFAVLVLGLALAGCARSTASIPLTGLSLPVPKLNLPFIHIPFISANDENDYSHLRWTEAFGKLHLTLKETYPYTEWKGIDWAALEAEFAPRVAEAETVKDEGAWYEALREYAAAVRDGNVFVSEDLRRIAEVIGGGYGINVTTLDDARVIVYTLDSNGPAAKAGILWGAQILEWNGQPVQEALAAVLPAWSDPMPATNESLLRQRERLLVRAPVGTALELAFRNPGGERQVVSLTAREDAFAGLQLTYPYSHVISESEAPLETNVLETGIGYVHVKALSSTIAMPFPGRALRQAVDGFMERGVPALIIDVRGNTGGIEDLVPELLAPLFAEAAVYKDVSLYDARQKEFVTSPELRLMIGGSGLYFSGPIAVLVDESTMGTGEGLPMVLDRLQNVTVVGITGTHGSFGIVGGEVIMPGDYIFHYPIGRSLDADGDIIVEANAEGQGGIVPDVRVPRTEETLRAMFSEEQDVVLEAAETVLLEKLNPSPGAPAATP